MITVKKLKELLTQLPDDARIYAYEGEDTGLAISHLKDGKIVKYWWIGAREVPEEENDIIGFQKD